MASDETTERHLLSLGIRCGCRNLKKGIVVEKKDTEEKRKQRRLKERFVKEK